jgi:hypothetical protein
VLVSLDGPNHNVLLKPLLVFSKQDADHLLGRLEVVLVEDFASPGWDGFTFE